MRRVLIPVLAGVLLLGSSAPAAATPLAPFIDLQEAGLSISLDGAGTYEWDPTAGVDLTVQVGGSVRFALLYWAGRDRPCSLSGDHCTYTEPYGDQEMVFDGTPLTGTIIGTETQPDTPQGPTLDLAYFADVTSLVSAAGTGSQTFTITDGNTSSDLWRLDGFSLVVAYTDASETATYRVLVWDGADYAHRRDRTPGDNRTTQAVTFGHGSVPLDRKGGLWIIAGDATAAGRDRIDISDNPSRLGRLNGSDGPQWDTDFMAVDIPAGDGTTSVRLVSRAKRPSDSFIWVAALMRVRTSISI